MKRFWTLNCNMKKALRHFGILTGNLLTSYFFTMIFNKIATVRAIATTHYQYAVIKMMMVIKTATN